MNPISSFSHPAPFTRAMADNKQMTAKLDGIPPDGITPVHGGKSLVPTGYADFREAAPFSKLEITKAANANTEIQLAEAIFRREMQARDADSALKQKIETRFQKHNQYLVNSLNKIYGNSLDEVYGTSYRIEDALEAIIPKIIKAALTPSDALIYHRKSQNEAQNEVSKQTYLESNERVCATAYLDITCGSLSNLEQFIEKIKILNIDMVHVLPTLYPGPKGLDSEGNPIDDDGGYAINSHRAVNPRLGFLSGESHSPTLAQIFQRFLKEDIRVIADFTINHTSEQSKYYKNWKAGVEKYKNFYISVDDAMRKKFEEHMFPFFPLLRAGNFTYDNDSGKYCMNRFKNSQKDLNWRNPLVAAKLFSDIFFLAKAGADVRIDAAPVMFKRLGTESINLPEVFHLMEALRAAMEIVAPSKFILAESINMPSMILPFLAKNRCEMSYNTAISTNNLPAIAAQDVTLLRDSLYYFVQEPEVEGVWLNAGRTHDEIFMQLDDVVALENKINKPEFNTRMHRFFTDCHDGSYARGFSFLSDAELGQFSGTLASLLGLEHALEHHDVAAVDQAIARINLSKAIRYALPGIPLVNLVGGDHVGSTNNPHTTEDSRDVHRIPYDKLAVIRDPLHKKASEAILENDINLLRARKLNTAFSGKAMILLDADNLSLLVYMRQFGSAQCLVIGNYAETSQAIDLKKLHPYLPPSRRCHNTASRSDYSFSCESFQFDVIQGTATQGDHFLLKPHQALWLVPKPLT